jgi:hypothetical protein
MATRDRFVSQQSISLNETAFGSSWFELKPESTNRGFSPPANYTDRATAACQPS